jgi:hypothetical protein
MTTKVCCIVAGNIKSLRKPSVQVKWYQAVGLKEEVQISMRMHSTFKLACIVSCVNSDLSIRN